MLKDVLHYAELGLSVIPIYGIVDGKCNCNSDPCDSPGKHPRTKWKSRSTKRLSKEQLKTWWKKYPNSNVGIVTGKISGIAVLDIDGEEGVESLRKMGIELKDLPVTPTARTGGGGYHFIFKMSSSAKTRAGILPNVDIRAEGGMIVAPPSLHLSGNNYTWIPQKAFGEVEIAEFDFSQIKKKKTIKKKRSTDNATKWYEACLSGVGEGTRNDSAARLAGRYLSLGMSESEVKFMMEAWNARNHPPLPESEIETVVESIKNKEKGEDDQSIDDSIDVISSALKMNLITIERITGDDPQYVMTFEEGKCTITIAQLFSPKLFQQAIAESTNALIKRLSSKTTPSHDRFVHLVMDCAKDIDAGIEATSTGEMIALLKDFIRGLKIIPNLDLGDEIPQHGSFRSKGISWIQIEELVHRGGQRWGMRIPMRSMAQKLKALGISKKTFKFSEGNDRTMWGINPDKLTELEEKHKWEQN